MYGPHTGQQLPATQKNASPIGGILSPARLPHLYPESFNPTFKNTRNSENTQSLAFKEKKEETDKRFIKFDTEKKTNPKRTREAFQDI
jgi:hypothetical protein